MNYGGNNGNGGSALTLMNPHTGRIESPQDVLHAVEQEREVVDKLLRLWDYGWRQYSPAFDIQALCQRFEDDRPWSDAELTDFSNAGRIPQSYNIIRSYVGFMSGQQRMSRAQIRVEGVGRGGDQRLADVGYKMLTYNAYVNNQTETDSLVYRDGLRYMGVWHSYWDAFRGQAGRVVVERVEPGAVIFDPNCINLQLEGCDWQARMVYMTPQAIMARWPGLDPKLFDDWEVTQWWEKLSEPFKSLISQPRAQMIDRVNHLFAVIDLVQRSRKRALKVIDPYGRDQIDPVTGKTMVLDADMVGPTMSANPGFSVKPVETVSMVTTCILPYKQTQLSKVEEPYQYYPYTPFLSGFSGQRFPYASSYDNTLVGPQREINITRSNQVEYLQRDLRGGGFVPGDTELTKKLNKDKGKVAQWYDIKGPQYLPKKIPPAMPAEGMRYLEDSGMKLLDIVSGGNKMSSQRVDYSGESGIHREQRQDEATTTNYTIPDMFDNQRGLVAKGVLERMVANIQVGDIVQEIGADGRPKMQELVDPRTGQTAMIDPATGQPPKQIAEIAITEELKSNLGRISEWDIRVHNAAFQTEIQRQRYDRKMQVFSVIAARYPLGIVLPGDFIRGGDFGPDEEELADVMDGRFLEAMKAPPTAPTDNGGPAATK